MSNPAAGIQHIYLTICQLSDLARHAGPVLQGNLASLSGCDTGWPVGGPRKIPNVLICDMERREKPQNNLQYIAQNIRIKVIETWFYFYFCIATSPAYVSPCKQKNRSPQSPKFDFLFPDKVASVFFLSCGNFESLQMPSFQSFVNLVYRVHVMFSN